MALFLRRLLWFFALGLPLTSVATHQVGGQLEMHAVGDVPGHFRLTVTQYLESGPRADQQAGGTLGIFRKRDNVQMTTFSVYEIGQRQRVIYANEYCAEQRNLKFIVAQFEADLRLTPSLYDDPQGYYISYQTRNRNGGINNIDNPLQTGYTFYLEFPPMLQNGLLFTNSSPHFGPINGEYICAGEPFTFPFGGTDPDGDELRYSMVTPLNQKGTNQNTVSPGPYPDVTWLSGFGADRAIPGSPTLSVNARTGQLSVTATQLGLYVFAVKVEEYRNGTKIGEVRRDFQFLVIDCPPATTPTPDIQIKDQPLALRNTTICRGDSAVLQATARPDWNYQWQRGGVNLSGANGPSLAVRESGDYTVLVSPKTTCTKVGNSESVTISVIGSDAKLSATGHLCATVGLVNLTATGATGVTYEWFRDGQPLAGRTADSLRTTQAGRYWTVMTHSATGCKARSDTAVLDRSPAVQVTLQSASGRTQICPQSTLTLTGSGGTEYAWQRDGQSLTGVSTTQFEAPDAGTYVLTATDQYGCTGVSAPLVLTQIPPVVVTLDSIPPVCGPDAPVSVLRGSPAGGAFGGAGVVGNEFSPQRVGVGDHTLTYTVKPAPECAGTVATRTAVVAPIPTIQLADSMTTFRGNTFTLNPVLTGNPTQFRWASAQYLDDPTRADPTVTDIASDITYTLAVQNSSGCGAKDTIRIRVVARVWVPDAFSPNGDGLNDVWALPGIEAFPDAVMIVFNRWGEVIYHSEKGYPNPFDGTLNGTALPTGVYSFVLHTAPGKPALRGSVVLLR